MIRIEKIQSDMGMNIRLVFEDGKILNILFGGNLDLYFQPFDKTVNFLDEKVVPIVFYISPENKFLYKLFKRLYTKILQYDAFDEDILENKKTNIFMRKVEDGKREHPLVHDGIVTWYSDEEYIDNASCLNISMEENKSIKLEFNRNNPEDSIYFTYAIRFRNSGSRYKPFNFRFMQLYNDLCKAEL